MAYEYFSDFPVNVQGKIADKLNGDWKKLASHLNILPAIIVAALPGGSCDSDYSHELIQTLVNRQELIDECVEICNKIDLNSIGFFIQELAEKKSPSFSQVEKNFSPLQIKKSPVYKLLYETDSSEYGHSINMIRMDLEERFEAAGKRSIFIQKAVKKSLLDYDDLVTSVVTGSDFLKKLPIEVPHFLILLHNIGFVDISTALTDLLQTKRRAEITLGAEIANDTVFFNSFLKEALKTEDAVQITLDFLKKQDYTTFDSLEELNTEEPSSLAITGLTLRFAKQLIRAVKEKWPPS